MTTPEALFGVVPFGRVDFGVARRGTAWPGTARARQGIWHGVARLGSAGHERGMESGMAALGTAGLCTSEAWRGGARNMGGHIRKHNKPTQHNTTWTTNPSTQTHS